MDDAYVLRKAIQGALEACITPLTTIVHDPKAAAKDRIHAFEALADRGGLPAVKATIAQTIASTGELDSMKERRERVLTERDQLKVEIAEIRKVLPQPMKGNADERQEERKRVRRRTLSREGQGKDDQEVQDKEEGDGDAPCDPGE